MMLLKINSCQEFIVSLRRETPFLGKFGHAEFNGCVHFICFIPETPFLVNEGKGSTIIVSATLREKRF